MAHGRRLYPLISSPLRVRTQAGSKTCILRQALAIDHGLPLTSDCEVGEFEQRIVLSAAEQDVLNISTRLTLHYGISINSVEDRYNFIPERHSVVNAEKGPLDFVWFREHQERTRRSHPGLWLQVSRSDDAAGGHLCCADAEVELMQYRTDGAGSGGHFGEASVDLFRADPIPAARA